MRSFGKQCLVVVVDLNSKNCGEILVEKDSRVLKQRLLECH
jgi:hypothetical protein